MNTHSEVDSSPPHATESPIAPGAPVSVPALTMPLTIARVHAIEAIVDTAVRNVWITESYADLGRRMGRLLGADHSWCTFAVWASDTAGVSIRGQELPGFVEDLLDSAERARGEVAGEVNRTTRLLRWTGLAEVVELTHVDVVARQAIELVSDHIAHGNTMVYSELGPIFVRFLERFELDHPEAGEREEVLKQVGVPPESVEPLVRNAFRHYYDAVFATDAAERAELVLAANISAVLHEQQRLQADIAASLGSGIDVIEEIVRRHVHRWVPNKVVDRLVDRVVKRVARPIGDLWDHIATELMMTLAVPGETLRLSRDVPPLPGGERWPATLDTLHLPALVELMDEWDPTGGTGVGSGAADWSDLHERMGYIVNLFRSRQCSASLGEPPFDADELAAMAQLRLPDSLA